MVVRSYADPLFAWLRYTKHPFMPRLLLVGIVLGLALATNFAGHFLIPSLIFLGIIEAVQSCSIGLLLRGLGAVTIAGLIAYVVLWQRTGSTPHRVRAGWL